MAHFPDVLPLYIGLSLICFFSPNICLIRGVEGDEHQQQQQQHSKFNNRNTTSSYTAIRSRSSRDGGGSVLSGGAGTDTSKVAKVTTVMPGCEAGTLGVCEKLHPMPVGHGIPSSPAAIEKACKAFNQGMDCYYNWARRCIKEDQMQKFNTSVLGAHEIYTFLCRDPVFHRDFLLHSKCYTKISKRWDECATKFIAVLKSPEINIKDESDLQICCLRYGFVQCVMQITHRKCAADDPTAPRFIQQMAETLLRSRIQGHPPEQCQVMNVKFGDCPTESRASQLNLPLTNLMASFGLPLLYRITAPPL